MRYCHSHRKKDASHAKISIKHALCKLITTLGIYRGVENDVYSFTLAQVGGNIDKVEIRENPIHSLCEINKMAATLQSVW